MLSIGKVGLARNQQLYYEQQVARGREDYYAGRGEAPGRWAGSAARFLGLDGEVDAAQLTALMDGRDPATGVRLARRTGRCSTAALDLTFSAPKSVSVLFAVGDHRLSGQLIEAHEEAVDAALAYLERESCRVRRGHNGTRAEREAGDLRGWERARSEPAIGFVAAAYRHRMSRAQDPHLHTHVVCANMAQGQDGRWTALYGRAIYEHAKAAGCVYQAHLRHEVKQRLPWATWGIVRQGMAELEQIPAAVREEFSQRRRRILEQGRELEAAGVVVGREGRERIAFATREPKREIAEADWRAQIRARASEHGLDRERLDRLDRLPAASRDGVVSEPALVRRLCSASGLTATRNSFAARDVVIAVAEAYQDGVPGADLRALAGRVLAHPEVAQISAGLDRRYTTGNLLRLEAGIARQAEEGLGRCGARVGERQVASTLHRLGTRLTDEQAGVVAGIAGSGNRIDVVEALAGTGKTTCAGALREVYERAGCRVIGAAPTARAVRELTDRAGFTKARTLDGWALELQAHPDGLVAAGARPTMLVIDEAGMAGTRVSARVIEAAVAHELKVVAIGDSGQLASVQAGGWLGALTRRLGAFELREVMRQRDLAERRALAEVHRGEPGSYLQLKQARGELDLFAGEQPGAEAERRLVARWAAARIEHGETEAVMICRDNRRRERLNDLARTWLRSQGELDRPVEIAGREWAVGERVIARRNDRARDLDNGMRATITALDEHDGATVRLDSGATRRLDPEYLAGHVQPAYALTGHGMQGGTVQWAGVIGQPHDFSRNWAYTALSRAREPTELFIVDEPGRNEQERQEIAPAAQRHTEDTIERMARRMRERDDEDLALEQLEHPQTHDERAADTANRHLSPARAHLYEVRRRLKQIHQERDQLPIQDAKTIVQHDETITAIKQAHERDRRPQGWRDRLPHKTRKRQRELHIEQLRDHQAELLETTPDPRSVLERAEKLNDRLGVLIDEALATRAHAIADELATRPPWLERTLGAEPPDHEFDRDRWQQTAREIAGHRIDHHITDPHTATHPKHKERDLDRSIAETRAALGLDRAAYDHDLGYEL